MRRVSARVRLVSFESIDPANKSLSETEKHASLKGHAVKREITFSSAGTPRRVSPWGTPCGKRLGVLVFVHLCVFAQHPLLNTDVANEQVPFSVMKHFFFFFHVNSETNKRAGGEDRINDGAPGNAKSFFVLHLGHLIILCRFPRPICCVHTPLPPSLSLSLSLTHSPIFFVFLCPSMPASLCVLPHLHGLLFPHSFHRKVSACSTGRATPDSTRVPCPLHRAVNFQYCITQKPHSSRLSGALPGARSHLGLGSHKVSCRVVVRLFVEKPLLSVPHAGACRSVDARLPQTSI